MPPKVDTPQAERKRIKALRFYHANRWKLQAQHKEWRDKTRFHQVWGKDAVLPVFHVEERTTTFSWD